MRVDARVTAEVMVLDVLHVHGFSYPGELVYIFGVVEQVWVLTYELLVAFEVNHIHLHITSIQGASR